MAVDRDGGRGSRQRGRRRPASDHTHPELMSVVAHDQELHRQFLLPNDSRVYFDYDTGNTTGGSLSWKTQFDPIDLDVPDWVEEVNIYCVAICEIDDPSSTGDFEARIVIDGFSSPGKSTHYTGDPSQCAVTFGRQITDPPSSLDIHVDTRTASSDDSLIVQMTTNVVFERFAGTQGGGGLAG